ncbi:unnamed protein product [Arabis nemorensis]|uniref:Phorbol-ester/DAG-type domain-containing protein n=1 Tax=Arabis nemorensis TaxID=586526 RepID=A0A565CT72_9BRAS|nr:unnamed protein product [Arabis nemorensis]
MDPSLAKLPTHDHPLTISARFVKDYCKGCHVKGPIYGGYRCIQPDCAGTVFHKECAEAPPEIINHPNHPQHLLKLGYYPRQYRCSLHGSLIFAYAYRCSQCNFVVCLTCGIKPSPLRIEHPKSHGHPLVLMEERGHCEICKINDDGGYYSYACRECDVHVHIGCVNLSQEVNHPCHPQHSLKLLAYESLPNVVEKTCLLCGEGPKGNMFYRCSICNFSICLFCAKHPPTLTIEHQRTHEHRLLLLSRQISFVCNACGMQGDRSPYMCIQCGFVVHRTCIDLPCVISINRHDHRMSFTHHLGVGYSNCGICRKDISQYNGAYSCLLCPNYAAHSQCATREDVWDGIEFEENPDDDEDIAPFKVVGDNLIKHFSHEEHNLRLDRDNINHDESSRCEACVLPICSDPIYNCDECSFILHEKCANLPKKKRLVFHTKPFTLWTRPRTLDSEDLEYRDYFVCSACGVKSTGFRYIFDWCVLDVRCGSRSEPFIHDGHIHPLYYEMRMERYCDGCHTKINGYALCCDACDFDLDLHCADLPKVVKHSCDDHPLTLCYGENASGKYWCDICEAETNPRKWFYTCSDCGVTAHIECVLGDFSRLMPGRIIRYNTITVKVVPNNHNSRPLCEKCKSRCRAPFILKLCDPYTGYICSHRCVSPYYKYN